MKLIPKKIINRFKNKIINIHPGKLPEFGGKGYYGMNVHRAVIDSGTKSTAVTVHYVNEEYDRGMIIHEEIIDVKEDDTPETLSERVLKYEHKIYSDVINKIINGIK
jgi:folate-dependent phosphoribosylglycinamide formyltransferase PurN